MLGDGVEDLLAATETDGVVLVLGLLYHKALVAIYMYKNKQPIIT